ncbi:MAG: beta/gamma crystallin-related protein [Pseudomonadota bacterium]
MSKIILFQNTDFGGKYVTFEGPVEDLHKFDFDNRTSSIIVCSGTWGLFQNTGTGDHGGKIWEVKANGGPKGDGVYPTYDHHWKNDSVSSLKPI